MNTLILTKVGTRLATAAAPQIATGTPAVVAGVVNTAATAVSAVGTLITAAAPLVGPLAIVGLPALVFWKLVKD